MKNPIEKSFSKSEQGRKRKGERDGIDQYTEWLSQLAKEDNWETVIKNIDFTLEALATENPSDENKRRAKKILETVEPIFNATLEKGGLLSFREESIDRIIKRLKERLEEIGGKI